MTNLKHYILLSFIIGLSLPSVALYAKTNATNINLNNSWEGSNLGTQKVVPLPWSNISVKNKTISVYGRDIIFQNSFIPAQIMSQNTPVFHAKPRMQFSINNDQISGENFSTVVKSKNNYAVTLHSTYENKDYSINAKTVVEYDGFIKIDLSINPKKEITLQKLQLEFPFKNTVAKKYSKYLAYDFDRQRIKKSSYLNSFKNITKKVTQFEFNPSIWVGNESIGLELISETNFNYFLRDKNKTHSFHKGKTTTFTTSFVNKPIRINKPIKYSFALLATPTKPDRTDLAKMYMVSALSMKRAVKHNEMFSGLSMLYFGHWARTPSQLPGLPYPPKNEINKYNKIRKTLQDNDIKFIPYSTLYILPSTLPEFKKHSNDWSAAPQRKGSGLWRKTLKTEKAIQPITLESKSIQDFILSQHIGTIEQHQTDGIYIDASLFWDLKYARERFISRQDIGKNIKKDIAYYPLFSHRKFVQRYWKAAKNRKKDFLILHHTGAYTPKFASTYVDIEIVGESLHQFFEKDRVRSKPSGRKRVYIRPDKYIPNYFSLDKNILGGLAISNNSYNSMLLPQVKRFNEDFLKLNEDKFIKWSRSAVATSFEYETLLWHARIDKNTVRNFVSALLRFDYYSFSHKESNTLSFTSIESNLVEKGNPLTYTKVLTNEGSILLFIANKSNKKQTLNIPIKNFSGRKYTKVLNAESLTPLVHENESFKVSIPENDYILLDISVEKHNASNG